MIEDKANGSPMVQELRRSTSFPIQAISPKSSKEERARVLTPFLEQKNVFLPKNHRLLADFLDETSRFPRAQHDDIVDAFTMALDYVIRTRMSSSPRLVPLF